MDERNTEVAVQKVQTGGFENKKQAVQFIIDQFIDHENKQLSEVVQKAEELKKKLALEELLENDSTLKRLARVARKIRLKKKIEELIENLRKKLEHILEREKQELERKEKLTCDVLTSDAVYEAACLLTKFWPLNEPYLPEEGGDASLFRKPVCMITGVVIKPNNRIISSTGDQFDGIALVGWLTRNPIHPKTRQPFNSRDTKQINEFARNKGFTPPIQETASQPSQPEQHFSGRSLRFIWGSFALWALGLILGGVGVSAAVATTLYLVGAFGILLGTCYLLYKGARVIGHGENNRVEDEARWDRYREELALEQTLSLSLSENSHTPNPSFRNEGLDFLYERSRGQQSVPSVREAQEMLPLGGGAEINNSVVESVGVTPGLALESKETLFDQQVSPILASSWGPR